MASTPVGKTWAAMSTPFGWATAAVTWAGRTDSANRHPTIHLRYPNVYVRFDADTFRRALEEWEAAARRYAEVRDALTLTVIHRSRPGAGKATAASNCRWRNAAAPFHIGTIRFEWLDLPLAGATNTHLLPC